MAVAERGPIATESEVARGSTADERLHFTSINVPAKLTRLCRKKIQSIGSIRDRASIELALSNVPRNDVIPATGAVPHDGDHGVGYVSAQALKIYTRLSV